MSPATDITMMTPLIIDLRGRTIIICGGGEVGARKARFFTDGGCQVIVTSRTFSDHFDGMDVDRQVCDLTMMGDNALQMLFRNAFLVVASTSDRTLNDRIGDICRNMGILCNNADGTAGDVLIPATTQGKSYLVAVTTFGKSPAFSRYLHTIIEKEGENYDRMISLQERVRSYLKDAEPSAHKRGSLLWEIINDPEVWIRLKTSEDSAWELLNQRYFHG